MPEVKFARTKWCTVHKCYGRRKRATEQFRYPHGHKFS